MRRLSNDNFFKVRQLSYKQEWNFFMVRQLSDEIKHVFCYLLLFDCKNKVVILFVV